MIKINDRYDSVLAFSQNDVDLFSKMSGDYNYIHSVECTDHNLFTGPIVHGALIDAEFSKILGTKFPGQGTIYAEKSLKYKSPLYVGEEAKFSIIVVDAPSSGRATVRTTCSVGDRTVCSGESRVIYEYVTEDIIHNKLINMGVADGDVVMVHSSFKSFGYVEGGPEAVIRALLRAVGSAGTIVMPTFNFDFCKGKAYDCNNTKSNMGILTEIVRDMDQSRRINHPIYSFSAIGHLAHELSEINNISAYGDDSMFAKLVDIGGKILILGLSYNNSMTFFHHVEEMVGCDYRYMKEFSGEIVEDGIYRDKVCSMFVRDISSGIITSVNPMGERLESLGIVSSDTIGRCEAKLMRADDVFEATKKVPLLEPHLLREVVT